MSNFKLIGIRPHKNCDEKFLKVLEPGRLYQFYNEYEFHADYGKFDGVNGEIIKYDFKKTVPDYLYKVGNLNVNISAVVGKNGTGKSSLIEFLYYIIYVLGINTHLGQNKEKKVLQSYPDKIIDEIKWKLGLLRKNDFGHKDIAEVNRLILHCQNEKINHDNIVKNFKGSLFYLLDEVMYEIKIDNSIRIDAIKDDGGKTNSKYRELKILNIIQETDGLNEDMLRHFFYTISINYSHYALNSNFIGNWINSLFHKNDGYKTPAVINPMRNRGNFDINDEMKFAKYRLLSNILTEKLVQVDKTKEILVTEKQFVKSIQFTYNKRKIKEYTIIDKGTELTAKENNSRNLHLLMDLYSHFYPGYSYIDLRKEKQPFLNEIGNYIIQKVDQIIETYDIFDEGYEYVISIDNLHERTTFVEKILEHQSHIVFKLKQALNFLYHNLENEDSKWHFRLVKKDELLFEFTIDELLDWMNVSKVSDIFNHLPPSIFDIDFVLSSENDESIKFSDLSSGEQQLIHSTQSAIYHINNLESINNSNDHVVKYQNICIIYDEIELYFHPDFQRQFISRLLNSLKNLNLGRSYPGINAINILFSTHSPFILSDIPKQNILQLKYDYSEETKNEKKYSIGLKSEKQTFGANIHELLHNPFFLSDGFMGAFAQSEIKSLIEFLKSEIDIKSKWDAESALLMINNIGEVLIKDALLDLYYSKFQDSLEEQISRLTNLRKNGSN